jgi:hypothetical protein
MKGIQNSELAGNTSLSKSRSSGSIVLEKEAVSEFSVMALEMRLKNSKHAKNTIQEKQLHYLKPKK